jgi:osmoprotectant transport system permease protein
MMQQLPELLALLPDYLGGHMFLSVAALALASIVSLPLGIAVRSRPRCAEGLLAVAGVVQTIPSLALLLIMIPLLGVIGFVPALVALTLYSILPILANTVLGIRGVEPALIEAAQGLGMTSRQMLWRVQLPLALPVLVSGIRTAAVMAVGTATLATPVGGKSLGNYIFAGMEMNDMNMTIFGCVCAAALAVLIDQLIRLLEIAARRRSSRIAFVAAAGLLLLLAGGLYRPIAALFEPRPVVVVSASFTEQSILSDVLKAKLETAGCSVDQRHSTGYMVTFLGFRQNQVDCCVNYSGDVWATLMKRSDIASRETTFDEASRFLREQYGVECLGKLGFDNAYALAMPRKQARDLKIRTIADLASFAPKFTLAGDMSFFERHEWKNLRQIYKLKFHRELPMDSSLMYQGVAGQSVHVVCAYSTDGRVKQNDLVLLEDPEHAFPPYDAMLLLSARAANDDQKRQALLPLVQSINADMMREANYLVDVEGQSPSRAAAGLLRAMDQK